MPKFTKAIFFARRVWFYSSEIGLQSAKTKLETLSETQCKQKAVRPPDLLILAKLWATLCLPVTFCAAIGKAR